VNRWRSLLAASGQDAEFEAGVFRFPVVTLYTNARDDIPRVLGFTLVNKGEWEKEVDASEVENITVQKPIDLSIYLPKK
jgi:hypothetical protein